MLPVLARVLYTYGNRGCLQNFFFSGRTPSATANKEYFSHFKSVKGLPYFAIYDTILKSTVVFVAPSIFLFINQNLSAEVRWPRTACNRSTGQNADACYTQSKALSTLQITPPTCTPWLLTFNVLSVTLNAIFSVYIPSPKPNCSEIHMLLVGRHWIVSTHTVA